MTRTAKTRASMIQLRGAVFAVLLLVLIGCAAVGQSVHKVFWWDELASYDIAHLPQAADVWSFFHAGLDTPSPVPTLIVQATLHLVGGSEKMVRLPFTGGFLLMCACLYGCVRRRYSAGYALAAMLIPAVCGVFYYASELRTYGIVLGAVAFALWCWSGLESGSRPGEIGRLSQGFRRAVGIAGVFLGLSAAIACHVFAVFVLIPFALGQAVRDWQRRRIDFAVWIALVLAPLSLIPELHGLSAAHRNYASLFWSKPSGGQILFSYSYAMSVGWLLATLLVIVCCSVLSRRNAEFSSPGEERGFSRSEWTLIVSLALLPFFAWPLSHLVGVYVARYVLPLAIGVSLAAVGGTAELLRRNRVAGMVLACALLMVFLEESRPLISSAIHRTPSLTSAYQNEEWVRTLTASNLPVVAPNTPLYAQMQHYVSPELERRLFYTPHTPAALRPAEDADAELSMQLFATRLPLRVQEFAGFAREHPEFLVVVDNPLGREGAVASKPDEPKLAVHWVATFAGGEELGYARYYIYKIVRVE
jgi:hypothetical protein